MQKIKRLFALMIAAVMIFGVCSCRSKKDDEKPAAAKYASDAETTGVTTTVKQEQTTAQAEQPTSQPEQTTELTEQPVSEKTTKQQYTTKTTSAKTQTQKAEQSEPAEITGVETVKDGKKTVVYPLALKATQKKFPVIVWANGTGCPTQLYTSLLKELANGGYIVVADSDVMSADGKTQIDSVDYIINKSSDRSSLFYNKADIKNIGACGHSQGGRSSVNAAQADRRIRCVVSIAGASSADEARGLRTPSLFLTGTNDLIVVSSLWCKPSYNAVAGRAAYASLKGAVHTTCMFSPKKISAYTIDWFDAYLKNDSDALKVFEPGGKLANDSDWKDFQSKN
ncbi:MAG: hypothetical protein IJU45_03165 [Clostridia bacterium]|nr:hypothetical protein [Clostridia bacterium]